MLSEEILPLIIVCHNEAPRNKLRGVSDRGRNRKPRLVGGVKGRTIIKLYLTGEPRPVGGELHC
jgi:hypothetical protein